MFQLCAPAFIYVLISLLDIIFNAYIGLYNNLLGKTIVVVSVTLFLNILCEKGFSEISWLIVLISFLLIVIIMLNNPGCNIYTYDTPISNTTTTTTYVNDETPTIHYYQHIPYGKSDPEYQS
jgi:hypothetical protein